jgi:hypothetical protein
MLRRDRRNGQDFLPPFRDIAHPREPAASDILVA